MRDGDLINTKLTVLAKNQRKVMVGNRRGKVFVTNTTWLRRRSHIWTLPTPVPYMQFVRIPRTRRMSFEEMMKPPESIHLDWDVIEMRGMVHRGYGLRVLCGYDSFTQRWYTAARPAN